MVFVSSYRWGINSLGSEGSHPGSKVCSKHVEEVAKRCILSFVRTDMTWHGLHMLFVGLYTTEIFVLLFGFFFVF